MFLESNAQVVMSFWVVGIELEGGVVGGNGSGSVALLLESIAQVVVSIWVVGLELKGLVEKVYEFIKSPLHSADSCQVAIDNVIFCSCGNQLSVNRCCVLKISLIH